MKNNWSQSGINWGKKYLMIYFIQMQPGAISRGVTKIQLFLVNESSPDKLTPIHPVSNKILGNMNIWSSLKRLGSCSPLIHFWQFISPSRTPPFSCRSGRGPRSAQRCGSTSQWSFQGQGLARRCSAGSCCPLGRPGRSEPPSRQR